MSELFDPGLQPERTELAWRRTALALGIGSLVAMRLLPATLGSAWWALIGGAGVLVSAALWISARRRYRTVNDLLREDGDHAALPGAGLLGALTAVGTGIGVVSIAVILAAHAA